MRLNYLITILLFTLICKGKCAKILGVFPAPGYSQFILCEKLMGELAKRGHEVTVISAYSPKQKIANYRTILSEEVLEMTQENLFAMNYQSIYQNIISIYEMGLAITEKTLKNVQVQKLMESNEDFDLVILENFFCDALMGFSKRFNAPLILFNSIGPSDWNHHLLGNPSLPSVNPNTFSNYSNRMNFWQRFQNTIATVFDYLYRNFVAFPKHNQLLKQYFPSQKDLNELINNASLILLNSHPTTTSNTALVKGMIEVGGFHVEAKKLPSNLQEFLDNARDGAIFFSLGSNLRSTDLSKEKFNAIMKVLSKLKLKVLWKSEAPIDGSIKSDHILISKWLPQSDILAHSNIKLFITHGGLLSVTEAVVHAKPLVGVPVFGDQKMNIARACENGFAVGLRLQELNEETLSSAINEVLGNEKYEANARKMSNIIRDQAVKPMDLAVFWIEYVIRHKGAPYLKFSGLDLYWFQFYLLDVLLFVLMTVIFFYFIIRNVVQIILKIRRKSVTLRNKIE